jgi:hypothetical protein
VDLTGIKAAVGEVNRQTVPEIERLLDEAVADLNNRLAANIDRAVAQVSNVIHGTLLGMQGITSKLTTDLRDVLAEQDGWTVTITVPPITIRLNKPKEE